jgi:hypothetical protein
MDTRRRLASFRFISGIPPHPDAHVRREPSIRKTSQDSAVTGGRGEAGFFRENSKTCFPSLDPPTKPLSQFGGAFEPDFPVFPGPAFEIRGFRTVPFSGVFGTHCAVKLLQSRKAPFLICCHFHDLVNAARNCLL